MSNKSTDIDGISKEQLEAAGIDIESAEDLSKEELLGLLTEAVSDGESSESDIDNSTQTDESSTTTTSDSQQSRETTTEYTRPDGFQPSLEQATLVQCKSQDTRKKYARVDLLGLSESTNRNILLIQYQPIPTTEVERLVDNSERLKIITIACTQNIPSELSDSVDVVELDDPSDVTQLGIQATGVVDSWDDLDEKISISVDSLDTLFNHKTTEGLFRFLHIFIGKLRARETQSHFFVDQSVIDKTEINTIKSLFDATIVVDESVTYE